MLRLGTHPEPAAQMYEMIGPALDVVGQHVRAGKARDRHSHSPGHPADQQRRQQRRVLGQTGDVILLLDRDRQVLFVRRGAHGISPRRLRLPLHVLEITREAIECRKLVGIDGEKVPGQIIEVVVAGEEHQRGGVVCLNDDVGDHYFEFADASRPVAADSALDSTVMQFVLGNVRQRIVENGYLSCGANPACGLARIGVTARSEHGWIPCEAQGMPSLGLCGSTFIENGLSSPVRRFHHVTAQTIALASERAAVDGSGIAVANAGVGL